jgi:hypothetical protein
MENCSDDDWSIEDRLRDMAEEASFLMGQKAKLKKNAFWKAQFPIFKYVIYDDLWFSDEIE